MHAGIVMGMVVLLLVTLFLWSRGPISAFKPWIQWFDKWDPKKQYRCLPATLMAYFYGPVFMYDIAKAVSREGAAPHDWYIDFIMSIMRTYGRGVIPGSKNAIMVPRNICLTLAPDETDTAEAVATRDAVRLSKYFDVTVNGVTLSMSETRVKQWPENDNDWRVLMCAGLDSNGWGCNFSGTDWKGDQSVWEKSPTNFLWKFYAIPYDSALIKGFVTNDQHWAGMTLFPDAMLPLLGVLKNQAEGGWYGFLKGGDRWGGYNSLSVQSYVWSDALNPTQPATDPCSNPAGYITSGLSFGLMAGPMFWSSPEAEGASMAWSVAKALIGGGVAAGIGGALGAASQGCFGQ